MKKIYVSLALIVASLISPALAAKKAESYERIVAVVDGKVILESDIMEALYQYSALPDFSTLDGLELKAKVLDKLIDEKIVLAKARLDTLLVGPDELNELVDNHIAKLAVNIPNKAQLAQRILQETGMTMTKFREYVGGQLSQQAILNKVRGKYVGRLLPTPKDVEQFYIENKEKLPKQYNCFKLRKLTLEIKPNRERLDSVRALADSLISELNKGVAFDTLADTWSQDFTSGSGGDLGFFKKGAHDPEFERYAFRTPIGRYTEFPIHTKIGYHIIKVLQRQDNEIQAAHILLRVEPNSADTLEVKKMADSVVTLIAKGESFATLSQKYSSDNATNKRGGLLGWFEQSQVEPSLTPALQGLQEKSASEPFLVEDTWNVLYLEQKLAERTLTIGDDFPQLEMMAMNDLSQKKLEGYLKKWRSLVYVNILDENLKKLVLP
ncbi:MAG: peptidylprolyl isomerase [Fibrobacterales bacterium]